MMTSPRLPQVYHALVIFGVLLRAAFSNDETELNLIKLIGSPNYIELRRVAEEALKGNPRSVAARLVLSHVAEERDQMVEAMRQAQRAWEEVRKLSSDGGGQGPSFVTLALYRLAELSGNLDRRKEQLAWIEEYERRGCQLAEARSGIQYPIARLKVVALLKLGRVEEVRRYLDIIASEDGMRGLTVEQLEMDRIRVAGLGDGDFGEAFRLSQALEGRMRSGGKPLSVGYLVNFAQWAVRCGDMDRALRLYKEATAATDSETRFNPYQGIAEVHLARGEWEMAQSAIVSAWKVLNGKKPAVRLEMQRSLRLTVARFYLCVGYPDKALEHVEKYYAEPQRMRDSLGSSVRVKAQSEYYRALAHRDFSGLYDGLTGVGGEYGLLKWPSGVLRGWESRQRLTGLISAEFSEANAPRTLSAVLEAGFVSQCGALPDAVGIPFARRVLEETGIGGDSGAYTAFFRSLLATEKSVSRREASEALAVIPDWDYSSRARMEVVLADTSSDVSEAILHHAAAWRLHPASLIGRGIPVRFEAVLGNRQTASLISRSPSFRLVNQGPAFTLEVKETEATFRGPRSDILRRFAISTEGDSSARAASVVRGVFVANSALTESTMQKLDGH